MEPREHGTALAGLGSWGCLRGPADLGMVRATSPLPLECWGSMLSFPWCRTVLLLQPQIAETGIAPPSFQISKNCFHMKLARTDSSGCPWPLGATLHLPLKHCGAVLFFPWKKNIFQVQASKAKIGNPSPKFHISKYSSQTKSPRTDKSSFPWLPEGLLSDALEHWGCAFLPMEMNRPSPLGAHGQNWNLESKIPSVQGFLPDKRLQDKQIWLTLPLVDNFHV